jgi:NAD+ kinase
MSPVGIVIKPKIKAAVPLACEIFDWLQKHNREICFDQASHKVLAKKITKTNFEIIEIEKLAKVADPIVTLGGDGTLIGVARYVEKNSPIMIGVNFGNLGFLTEIHPTEALSALERVLAGKAEFAERAMLMAEVRRGGQVIFTSQAVNDAVVQKGVRESLLDMDISVDDREVMRLRADGVIVATPTGSTAYSLSASGSIVHPSLEVVLLTPICPHSLTNRPLILNNNSSIKIKIPEYDGKVYLIIDGQISTPIMPGDELFISRAHNKVRFVKSASKNYFDILRTKLNWGIANKAD